MAKTLTTLSLRRYPNSAMAKYGLVGGLTAVVIMTVFIFAIDIMMGFPADAFFTMIGLSMNIPAGQATIMGGAVHILMGTIFGALTGVLANSIPYFRNRFIGKGTGRATLIGVLSGTALFVVLFAPLLTILMPPAMMSLLRPLFLIGGLVLHWLYGGILGTVRGRLLPQ